MFVTLDRLEVIAAQDVVTTQMHTPCCYAEISNMVRRWATYAPVQSTCMTETSFTSKIFHSGDWTDTNDDHQLSFSRQKKQPPHFIPSTDTKAEWMIWLICYHFIHSFDWWWWLFPHVWEFWENVWSFIPCQHFFPSPKVEISLWKLILLFRLGSVHSGSATWDTCNWAFPDKLFVSSFPGRFPLCLDRCIVSPLRLQWVKGVCVFRCNLPSAILAEWPVSFTCHCGNTGVEWTPKKSQHTKLTLERKILPPPLPGFEPATFQSRVWRSHQQAILASVD